MHTALEFGPCRMNWRLLVVCYIYECTSILSIVHTIASTFQWKIIRWSVLAGGRQEQKMIKTKNSVDLTMFIVH